MLPPRQLPHLLAAALLLAACSNTPQWVKPGADKESVSDDLDDCRALANAATRREAGIDQDILATRGADWARDNALQVKKSTFTVQNQGRVRDIIAGCMSAKGYTPAQKR